MDENIQHILDNAMGSSSPTPSPAALDDPNLSRIVGEAGVSMAPQASQDSQSSLDNSWDSFKQRASHIVQSRNLPQGVLPVLLSQAADESARGQAAPGNNYFGIKGKGTAGANNLATQEYGDGGYYGENSNFAAYNSPEDSINAYLDLIMGYKGVPEAMQTNDPREIIRAIEANGYATSPTYVQTIESMPEFQGK